jgi:hypothetical protein
MTDEAQTNETVTTTEAPTLATADVRKHEEYQKRCAEIKAVRDELAAYKQKQAEAEEAAKLAEYEKTQNFDAYKAEIAQKHEAALAEKDAQILSEQLTNKLVIAGITHPFAIDAAIRQYEPGGKTLDEYVAAFIESDEVKALVAKPDSEALPPAPGGAAATRSTGGTLEDRLNSTDADVAKNAAAEYWKKLGETGVSKG